MRGTLAQHLSEIEQRADEMEEQLMTSLMDRENVPDRQSSPVEWAAYMENLHSRVDEMIRSELILR